MTCEEVMAQLKKLGTEQTRKTFLRHGAPPNFFGVKIGDLKVIQKKIKVDQKLALELYATGNSDAMYLAALIADDAAFTRKQLQEWADAATWYMLSEYSVAWVAAGSPHGWAMGLKWIESKEPKLRVSGWSTLSNILGTKPDEELDLPTIEDDPRGEERPGALCDEQLRHRGRLLREAAPRQSRRGREGDRQGRAGHGRHRVQGAPGHGVHRACEEHKAHREKAEACQVLSANPA